MEEKFRVVGKDQRSGVGRDNRTWTISNVIVDYHGKPCKIRIPNDLSVQTGDFVTLTIGSRRAYGGSELVVTVKDVVKQENKTND